MLNSQLQSLPLLIFISPSSLSSFSNLLFTLHTPKSQLSFVSIAKAKSTFGNAPQKSLTAYHLLILVKLSIFHIRCFLVQRLLKFQKFNHERVVSFYSLGGKGQDLLANFVSFHEEDRLIFQVLILLQLPRIYIQAREELNYH